jgi:molybdopterin/thiamine biosynthesis adenylyltransferase
MENFNYELAFSRNLGWITEDEFKKIKNFKIAIAGMGGVGGGHLTTLIRMGFRRFVIADFDVFEIQNFNRQYGANITSLGKKKSTVMKDLALQINPEAEIEVFEEGVKVENVSNFLNGVDLYVDGLDVFEIETRREIFAEARKREIPCVTSAPIGFGATCLVFDKNSISFEKYFQFKSEDPLNNLFKFVVGIAPSFMHLKYLMDRNYSNFTKGKTSSTPAGCLAASTVICSEAIKILLNRGPRHRAPRVLHYDFYLNRFKSSYVWWGLNNPLMRLKLFILKIFMR